MPPKDPQDNLPKKRALQSFNADGVPAEKAFSASGAHSSAAYLKSALASISDTSQITSALSSISDMSRVTSALASISDTSHITSALASISDTSHITSALASISDTSHITSALASISDTSHITSVLDSLTNPSNITSILNSISNAAQIKSTLSALASTSITSAFDSLSSTSQIRSVLDGISGAAYRSPIDSISSAANTHSALTGIASDAGIQAFIDSISTVALQGSIAGTLSKIDAFERLTPLNLSAFAALNRSVVSKLNTFAALSHSADFAGKQTLDPVFQDARGATQNGGLEQISRGVSNEHLEGLLLVILGSLTKKKKITAMEWYMAVMTLLTILLTVSTPVWTKAVEGWIASKAPTPLQIANIHVDERRVLKLLQMRMNAGARSPVVGMVRPGTLVAVIDIQKDWTLIESKDVGGNRIHGWVFSRYLEKVRPRRASTNAE